LPATVNPAGQICVLVGSVVAVGDVVAPALVNGIVLPH
jgi:hypothetical protein